MTSPNLARWIKTTDTRRPPAAAAFERAPPHPSNMRACLHAAVATLQSGVKAFVADHGSGAVRDFAQRASRPVADLAIDNRTGFSNAAQDRSAPGYVASVTPEKLAKMLGVALAMIAGILAFDLLVLWIAAGRLIERLPF
jgi:hypothetical protein